MKYLWVFWYRHYLYLSGKCSHLKNQHFSAFHFSSMKKRRSKTVWVFSHSTSCYMISFGGAIELYKKDLHNPDNHDGVNTDLEPDILECEVKWALESITTNKASGGDGIPVELFQIMKDDAVKVLHSICQQIWKTQQWPQDWKRSVSFQSQRKAIPKNAQTTAQLHSSHTLVK